MMLRMYGRLIVLKVRHFVHIASGQFANEQVQAIQEQRQEFQALGVRLDKFNNHERKSKIDTTELVNVFKRNPTSNRVGNSGS